MPDYARLVDGLLAAAEVAGEGRGELSATGVLITTAQEATGAAGATFTEYRPEGGRVVCACGAMDFALGQPIAADLVDRTLDPRRPFGARVQSLPSEIADPLLDRGIESLMGQPIQTSGRIVGAAHLYFVDAAADTWRQAEPALRVVAAAIAHAYCGIRADPQDAQGEDDRALFLAVAGHELRTPATVVKGYASMLADRWDSLDDGSRRDAARVLTQRADELARLVDRILGAAAADSSAGWLVRVIPFDPAEALQRAVADLPAEQRRGVVLQLPDRLPPASGDPAILTSIVAELVTNAGRNMVQPGDEAPIELVAGADADTVFFRVCDRGVGIHPADVERAFERFWRARGDGVGRVGVGLGLYLVRRLVERQGGWVSLRPREGGGTVAEVRLQRADGPHRPRPAG
jgi:signal transduction histidine kinase